MQTKSSLPCFALISNIIRNTLGDFMWKYRWNIRFKKYGISNQPNGCIFDDPCLSKFGALHGSCPHSGRQFVGLLCVSLIGTRKSAHCLRCVGHAPVSVQTWKRHGIRCSHPAGRNTHIFLQRMFPMQFHPESASCASCNITYHQLHL